ncbi:MAG: hypothetical protein HMLIMOIP_001052 [Candidatus Nitrosomirales archaeon]|jgi:hypothetical protein
MYAIIAAVSIGILAVALVSGLYAKVPVANGNTIVTSNDNLPGDKVNAEQGFSGVVFDNQGNDSYFTLYATGTAIKKVSPDKVSITLGVETQEMTAKEAAAKNAEMMNAIINKLKALGLSTDEISTSYYNIYPVYEYPPVIYEKDIPRPQSPVLVGYRVTNTIIITTSASEDVGATIDAAVDAGANQVQGVSFFVSEEVQGQMNKQLIEQAVLDARAKAQSALSPLNMQIVGVKNINLNDVYFPVYSYDKAALEGGAAPTPILSSQQQVSASVSVTFIIGSK